MKKIEASEIPGPRSPAKGGAVRQDPTEGGNLNERKDTMKNTELGASAPPKLVRRRCCHNGTKFFLEPPDVDETIAYRVDGKQPEAAGEVDDTPPTESTAWHEAGHAVFGHALGMPVDFIRIHKPALVRFKHGNNLAAAERIAVDFAGAVGEMSRLRCWSTIAPHDEDDYLSRIEAGLGGGCDEYGMARWAWMSVGLDAGREVAREVFRGGQRLALSIGQRRDFQNAIGALAGQLIEHGALSGKRAHSIIEPFVPFGSLKATEESC